MKKETHEYKVYYYDEGLGCIQDPKTKKYGFVDRQGNEVIPCQYKGAHNFCSGLCPVQDPETDLWGYINHQGEYEIKPQYKEASNFTSDRFEDLAVVQNEEGLWGVIDVYNRTKVPFRYNYLEKPQHWIEDMITAGLNGKDGLLTTNGLEILPCCYEIWVPKHLRLGDPADEYSEISYIDMSTGEEVTERVYDLVLKGQEITNDLRERGVLDIIEWLGPTTALAETTTNKYTIIKVDEEGTLEIYGENLSNKREYESIDQAVRTHLLAEKDKLLSQDKTIDR